MMKILITYYSGTGNTEKIARAIREELMGHEADLFPVKEVSPESLNAYDLIFLGSGVYGFNVNRKITTLVKKAPQLPSCLAFFYTHGSVNACPEAFKSVNKIIDKEKCQVLGEFHCCGENLVKNAEQQRQAFLSRLTPEERENAEEAFLQHVKGHPDEEDLENAKKFARSMLNMVK